MLVRAALVALPLGGVAMAAPSLAAANPKCGATVTHDVALTSDMDCSGSVSDGIVVGKSGITINLNGHTLTGPTGSFYGIDDSAGYGKVTVENGTITNYNYDVLYEQSTGSKILHVDALAANYGIYFLHSKQGLINHSTASSTNVGFSLYKDHDVKITNSKANNNSVYGVWEYHTLATLDNVTANSNSISGVYVDSPLTDQTSKGTVYDLIENSTANKNLTDGFHIQHNSPPNLHQASLIGNTANSNGAYGFYADNKTKGKGNHATGNGTLDCYHVPCG